MLTSDFNYDLPEELIAQFPPKNRGESRMMVLDRRTGAREIRGFSDLPDYLSPDDCVVLNNTKVVRARFFGRKSETGAKIEIFLTMPVDASAVRWKAFIKPGKRVRSGTVVELISNDEAESLVSSSSVERNPDSGFQGVGREVRVVVESVNGDGTFDVSFDPIFSNEIETRFGHTPLPPYIKRSDVDSDSTRYQTVFAKEPGAVAAPTAGLHFTDTMLAELAEKGVRKAEVTLHVGPGTFRPVSVENPDEHEMHSERFTLTSENAGIINLTRRGGGRIFAVGTTSVRVLETCAGENGFVEAKSGTTDIFLRSPLKPKAVDMLLTNFHLPKSTLLMLVATFAELDDVLSAYEEAKNAGFRFFSYGDCMLLKW
ncbi:MAG: tRNA preQ1(34) S-adenosylmethionine ribosyltransferase-isomerase QueA [Kiritimatiellaeota bacterium]|nr:tRNA preQ1(34) S-adenosylmethionine ribosyltransferase-isomerase QueA [Kiritimatiellota bacterium]